MAGNQKMPRIGIDARDVYTPSLRGVGKTLSDLLRVMLRGESAYEFFLYFEPSKKMGQFSQFKNVKEKALDKYRLL